ncbi:MAG: hypothetical protein ACJAYN_001609 [Bermanella sp.]|jgi:hypothetical protein|uniref:hypothetical protein n=1 Tax=Glaciecola sp. 33A TaxID=2057807 RepID=UPI0012FEAE8A|nr:hypothetical protein [Glaciecola sp. 33A]
MPEIEQAFMACIDEIANRVNQRKDIAAKGVNKIELKSALTSIVRIVGMILAS